jgi:hypothetical protein
MTRQDVTLVICLAPLYPAKARTHDGPVMAAKEASTVPGSCATGDNVEFKIIRDIWADPRGTVDLTMNTTRPAYFTVGFSHEDAVQDAARDRPHLHSGAGGAVFLEQQLEQAYHLHQNYMNGSPERQDAFSRAGVMRIMHDNFKRAVAFTL